jgi:hypothetical protein
LRLGISLELGAWDLKLPSRVIPPETARNQKNVGKDVSEQRLHFCDRELPIGEDSRIAKERGISGSSCPMPFLT